MKVYVFNDDEVVKKIKAYLNIINGSSLLERTKNYNKYDNDFTSTIGNVKGFIISELENTLTELELVHEIDDEQDSKIFSIYENDYILKSTIGSCIIYREEFVPEIINRINKYQDLKFILDYKDKGKGIIIC